MIVPIPEILTEERTEDILNDLEHFANNQIKNEFNTPENVAKKSLNDILYRLTTTSYELYDFLRLDSILKVVFKLFDEQIADTLCIILLRGINFNLNYYIHKYNVHEKQNIKIKYINMDERVSMCTLKAYLCKNIKERTLLADMKSIRFFVAYHVLYKDHIKKNLSLGDIYLKSKSQDKLNSREIDETGLEFLKGWKSETDLLLKREIRDLNPSKKDTRFEYSGDIEIFYLLEYLITGNSNILTKWLIYGTISCDWAILGLPTMNDFIVNEIRFIKDISFIYSVILQSKSHDLLSKFLVKILYRIGFNHTLHVLILSSFDPRKIEDTIYLLKRLYKEDRENTNNILRDLIVSYRPEELKSLFLAEYTKVDKNYIECLKIYLTSLGDFSKEDLRKIMYSEYFPILLDEKEDFYFVLKVYERMFDEMIPILLKMKWEVTEDNFEKLRFLFMTFSPDRDLFVDMIDGMIKKMYRIHKKDCKGSHESYKLTSTSDCAPLSCVPLSCSFNLSDISTTIKVVHPQYREESDTKGIKRPEKSYKSEMISNASTLEEIRKISKLNKKYKIKEERKAKCCQNLIRAMIDFVFVFRHQGADLKKVFKLNQQGFVERLIEEKPGGFDAFFVKAMNIVLSSGEAETILGYLCDLPIYKDEDYWSVAIRRNLKIKIPKKESKEVYSMSGSKKEVHSQGCKKEVHSQGCKEVYLNDSTLRESYLDLSQINESKIVVESKIDQSVVKILDDRSLYNLLRRRDNPLVKAELSNRRKFPTGLAMKDSSITISEHLHSFTLNMKVYQFDTCGIQNIVEVVGRSKILKIGTLNGKLFQETIKAGITERKLLEHEMTYREYMYLEMAYSRKNLKISINSKNYTFCINKLEEIVLGRSFKGIINKILLFESTGFRNCRIGNLNGSYLYIKVLHKLERYLKYNNLKGVYLDSPHPYYFNGKINLKISNVL